MMLAGIHKKLDRIESLLEAVVQTLTTLLVKGSDPMPTSTDLAPIQSAVDGETTVIASVTTLLTQLSGKVHASANDPAAVKAIAAQINALAATLADAVVANTPAAAPAASTNPTDPSVPVHNVVVSDNPNDPVHPAPTHTGGDIPPDPSATK